MMLFDNSYGKASNMYRGCEEFNIEEVHYDKDTFDDYNERLQDEQIYYCSSIMQCPKEPCEILSCVCCTMKWECPYERDAA